jgi:hypothetical protein
LEAAEMRYLNPLLGYTKLDHQRNVVVKGKCEVQSVIDEIQTYQKDWKEHVGRMQDERLPKLAVKCKPVGK